MGSGLAAGRRVPICSATCVPLAHAFGLRVAKRREQLWHTLNLPNTARVHAGVSARLTRLYKRAGGEFLGRPKAVRCSVRDLGHAQLDVAVPLQEGLLRPVLGRRPRIQQARDDDRPETTTKTPTATATATATKKIKRWVSKFWAQCIPSDFPWCVVEDGAQRRRRLKGARVPPRLPCVDACTQSQRLQLRCAPLPTWNARGDRKRSSRCPCTTGWLPCLWCITLAGGLKGTCP